MSDYIETISQELEEAETSIRAARRYNEARDPDRFDAALLEAFGRMEYAQLLMRAHRAEAAREVVEAA